MATLREAKASYQQAEARLEQLNQLLVHYLEQQGFPPERAIETDAEFELLCQLAEGFMAEEFTAARQDYRAAADQLKESALIWLKAQDVPANVLQKIEAAMQLPYREQELLQILLRLPTEDKEREESRETGQE